MYNTDKPTTTTRTRHVQRRQAHVFVPSVLDHFLYLVNTRFSNAHQQFLESLKREKSGLGDDHHRKGHNPFSAGTARLLIVSK